MINNKIGEVPERDTHKRIGWKDQAESGRNQLSVVQKHLTRKERTGGKENERAERGREAEREKKENGSNGSITRLPQLNKLFVDGFNSPSPAGHKRSGRQFDRYHWQP